MHDNFSAADGRDTISDIEKIDTELRRYSPELSERPQIMVANNIDSHDFDCEEIKAFEKNESDLRSNACIAYNKVLKNNAECEIEIETKHKTKVN